MATETEALLVTLSAKDIVEFLAERGEHPTAPTDEADARRAAPEIFAEEEAP